jgi:insulysin
MSTLVQSQTPATPDCHLQVPVKLVTELLEIPYLDKRLYRVVMLPNKMEVLLIHDPHTDIARAAMDVHVGSYSNPVKINGLAHAVEHTLTMGTKRVRSVL